MDADEVGRLTAYIVPTGMGEPPPPAEILPEHRTAFLDGYRRARLALAYLSRFTPTPEAPGEAAAMDPAMPAADDIEQALAAAIRAYENGPNEPAAEALGRLAAMRRAQIGHEPSAWRSLLPHHIEAYNRGHALERLRALAPPEFGEPHAD